MDSREYRKKEANKKLLTISAIVIIIIVAFMLNPKNIQVDETETEPEPEPIRPTVSSWQLDHWSTWVEKQITGQTEEAQVPNGAIACKVVVYWEGTSPIDKGKGGLTIHPRILVDAGDHNDIIHLENEELDVDKSLLNTPGSIELIVYVEKDALYYFFVLYKANIGECKVEVYFGY